MGCNCGGGRTTATQTAQYEVRLPDGTRKVVSSEPAALAEITMAGGGEYSVIR